MRYAILEIKSETCDWKRFMVHSRKLQEKQIIASLTHPKQTFLYCKVLIFSNILFYFGLKTGIIPVYLLWIVMILLWFVCDLFVILLWVHRFYCEKASAAAGFWYAISHQQMLFAIVDNIVPTGIQLLSKNGIEKGSPVFWLIIGASGLGSHRDSSSL